MGVIRFPQNHMGMHGLRGDTLMLERGREVGGYMPNRKPVNDYLKKKIHTHMQIYPGTSFIQL